MTYYIVSSLIITAILIYSINKYGFINIVNFIYALYLFSFLSGIYVNRYIEINSVYDIVILVYTFLFLILLTIPVWWISYPKKIRPIKNRRLRIYEYVVRIFGGLGLLSTSIISVISLIYFRLISVGIDEFKNNDIANTYLEAVIPGWFSTLMGITVPFGFLSLALHFYYLVRGNKSKALLYLIISLSIPVGALHELSRGRLVMFIFLYIAMLIYFRKMIAPKTFKLVKKIAVIFLGAGLFIFIYISIDRFSDSEHTAERSVDPVTYSLLDYGGQWHEYSYEVLRNYDSSKIMHGSRFRYISRRIERLFGYEPIEQFELDIITYGTFYGTKFRGIVSNIIYDLGYLGSIVFIIFYLIFMRILLKKKYSSLNQIHTIVILILFLTFFFQGNILVLAYVSNAIVYMLIASLFFKVKI